MQSVPGTAHVETSLISPNIQRLTQSLGRTDHPLSIIFSAPGVAKEAGRNSRSAGPGFSVEASCCLKDDANRIYAQEVTAVIAKDVRKVNI